VKQAKGAEPDLGKCDFLSAAVRDRPTACLWEICGKPRATISKLLIFLASPTGFEPVLPPRLLDDGDPATRGRRAVSLVMEAVLRPGYVRL
jgi:hypothetical protein